MFKPHSNQWLQTLITASSVSLFSFSSFGASYFVQNTVDESGVGSISSPFKHIQECADVAQPGDTCFIRGGTYRESFVIRNSGSSGTPIVFTAYQNENVLISGFDRVESEWHEHQGQVWKTELPQTLAFGKNQVFIGGEAQMHARWPNMPGRNTDMAREDFAISEAGELLGSSDTVISARYRHAELPDWSTGAMITLMAGMEWWPGLGKVTSYDGESIDFDFELTTGHIDVTPPADNDPFMLWGKLEAVDAEQEYFVDVEGDYGTPATLYVFGDPRGKTLEIKTRSILVNTQPDTSYFQLIGLNFKGGAIFTGKQSRGIVIDGIRSEYASYSMMDGWSGAPVLLRGENHQIINSHFQYTSGEAINAVGDNHIIRNNVMADGGYGITTFGSGGVIAKRNAFNLTLENNTIFNSGMGIQFSGAKASKISNNHVFNIGKLGVDMAAINSWNGGDGYGTEISYNLVHDVVAYYNPVGEHWGGSGIRLDSGGAPVGHCNWIIHHNIVHSTTKDGMQFFGNTPEQLQACNQTNSAQNYNGNLIYNNTSDNGLLLWTGEHQGTEVKNNLFMTGLTGRPGEATLEANNFRFSSFVDADSADFRLLGNALAIDTGVMLSPYTDDYVGSAPDKGALEQGQSAWSAGAVISQNDLENIIVACDASTSHCNITGMPVGRKLPEDFTILVADAVASSSCSNQVNNLESGSMIAECVMHSGVLSGEKTLAVQIANGDIVDKGLVDFGEALVVHSVLPEVIDVAGGDIISLSGQHFGDTNETSYQQAITVFNPSAHTLADYAVMLRIDTQQLIAQGKMNPDCSDMRFQDSYSELSYWMDETQQCNRPDSKVWVKATSLQPGDNTLTLFYGVAGRASKASCDDTFLFCDTMDDSIIADEFEASRVNDGQGISMQEVNGEIRISGQANGLKHVPAGFNLDSSVTAYFNQPYAVDIDVKMADLGGASRWKANFGGISNMLDVFNGGSDVGYWVSGQGWIHQGTSTVLGKEQQWNTFTNGVNKDSETLFYLENGELRGTADREQGYWHQLGFAPQRDDISWDVRVDNFRIRHFAPDGKEPYHSESGEESVQRSVNVYVNGVICDDISVDSDSQITCTAPAYQGNSAEQSVAVAVTKANGQSFSLSDGVTYKVPQSQRNITVQNAESGTLTDYQVKITLDTASLISEASLDESCSSLRFYQNDTQLDYWMDEQKQCNSADSVIWIKIPVLQSGENTIELRYASLPAASVSNCEATFFFCDDMQDNLLADFYAPAYGTEDGGGLTLEEKAGEIRISGQSNAYKHTPSGFNIDSRRFRYPNESYALDVDVKLEDVDGSTRWKANFGGVNNQLDVFNGGLDVGYWTHDAGWSVQGSSTIADNMQHWNTFTTAYGKEDNTVYYYENGSLRGSTQHYHQHMWHQLGFAPQTNDIDWDIRVDNLRIRKFTPSATEPYVSHISEAIVSLN